MTKLQKGRDSGVGRADAAGQIAVQAQGDRQCLGPGGLVDGQAPRVKWIAKELGQAQADS